MAVAPDSATESHTGTTGSTSEASFSWTHTPTGTPAGVIIFVFNANNTGDDATSVTYGGVTVPAVTGGMAADTATEPGRCRAFFLGSSIPTGAQTVVVNRNNNANIMYSVAAVVTASTDTEVYTAGIVLLENDGTLAEQNVDDGSPGTDSWRYAGLYTGLAAPPAKGANSTVVHTIDLGAFGCSTVRETTGGQGSRPVGWGTGTSDDRAAVHLAIREVVAAAATPVKATAVLQAVNRSYYW